MTTLSLDEFENLSGFIYRKTGIRFESKKIYYISKRIEKRMEALSVETVNEYIRMLRFSDSGGCEFQNLVDLLTINETYFFRDFPQLQAFGEHCLADVAQRKAARGDQRLRVWSAPCSTGEEPYTLGIILDAMLDNIRLWEIEIIASDIDRRVLDTARSGKYEQRRLRDVPPEYMQDYFLASANGTREISKKIRGLVKFEHLNLCDKESLRSRMGFDFIFCRNLLIYFDEVSRKQLVDQFYLALNPGGYIFLGSSESVGRISTAFKMKRVGGYLVYYKP